MYAMWKREHTDMPLDRETREIKKQWFRVWIWKAEMVTVSNSLSRTGFTATHSPLPTKPCHLSHKLYFPTRINCSLSSSSSDKKGLYSVSDDKAWSPLKEIKNVACGLLAVWAVTSASPVVAANQRLPPLSMDPDRCQRAFVGNTIGQANGVYDTAIDLRSCDYKNEKINLKGKSLTAALMSDAMFDGADMSEVVMSKAYAVGASFKGTDFTNAVLDRVNFGKANLQGAVFKNTVLSGSTFDGAELKDAIFEDTIIGYIDLQKLCRNTTITEDGRAELGCR